MLLLILLVVLSFGLCPGGPLADLPPARVAPALPPLPEVSWPQYRLPEKLFLCGEPVPLEDRAVREALDREFTVRVWSRVQTIMWLKQAHRYFPAILEKIRSHRLYFADAGMFEGDAPVTQPEVWLAAARGLRPVEEPRYAAAVQAMDKQAAEMRRDLEGAKVERVGEGIKITFDSGLLFDINKYGLKGQSRENLAKLATILNKYPDTNVLIEGHTDSTGTREINQPLSENRAKAVSAYLATQNVQSARFTVMGYGPDQPVGDNATVEGRQQNRRVDRAIMANEKLKKAAQDSIK